MSKKCELLAVGVMSGNNVSHSNRKTKRRFLPNLKTVALKSDVLGVNLKLKVTASTLRTVNKYGNIDNFLVNYRYLKLTDLARKLRGKVKKKLEKEGRLNEIKIVKESKPKEKVAKAAA